MSNHLLDLQNVSKVFRIGNFIWGSRLVAVDDVNLSLSGDKPSILSVVGESGSGKTTLAKLILRLAQPTSGQILIDGRNLFGGPNSFTSHEFMRFVQPIFQNPFESFSARRTVESYLYETALNLNIADNRSQAQEIIADTLKLVGLSIESVAGKYRNQFSGGELQRISVARALIPRPKLIVADEPVSMIDASLRMNIVNLFLELKEKYNVSFIYITHDLSTAYYVSNYIAIMYRGNIVEYGSSNQILEHPEHPYTELLMESVPRIGEKWTDDLSLPDPESKEYALKACKFAGRCPYVESICREQKPPMVQFPSGRKAFCYRPVGYQPGVTTAPEPVSESILTESPMR